MSRPPLRPLPFEPEPPDPEVVPGSAASRYRRPDRPAPGPGEAAAQAAESETTALEPASAEPAGALSAPLAALAAAFQANADALRRSQEVQADLGRALQRADRSEMMVQTTGALNDTFKNLSSIQRGLLDRIEESNEATKRGRWFLPVLGLLGLGVVGVAIWFVVERLDDVDRAVASGGVVAERVDQATRQARDDERRKMEASHAAEVGTVKAELERLRAENEDLGIRLKALEQERDTERDSRRSAESDLLAQRSEIQAARNDVLARRAIEEENAKLRAEGAVRGPEVERLKRELDEEKRASADLRLRLAEAGLGRAPAAPAAAAATAPATEPPPAPSLPGPGADPSVIRERRTVERVRGRLNELLQAGNAGRSDFYQVQSVGGLSTTRLVDVVAMRYAPNGRLLNAIRAKELRVIVDRQRQLVEFAFTDGTLDYNNMQMPFPDGAYSAIVAEGELSAWSGSGLTFVAFK